MEFTEPRAGEGLERTLERYARVRLDPSQAQARLARSAVMAEAWRLRLGETVPARRRGLFSAWSTRRLAVSLTAAVLAGLVIGSSTFAASRAGGVLYEARVALEVITLPTEAGARLDAEIAQAQSRLSEVVDASARGDLAALDASLAAYESSVDRLTGATGAPASRALEAVRFHQSILLGVLARAPGPAVPGLNRALVESHAVIDRLESAGAGDDSPGTNQGAGNGNGNGNGAGNGNGNGAGNGNGGAGPAGQGPASTPRADKTAKPAHTPRPDHPVKPAKSPAPGGPKTSPKPGGPTDQSPRP